MYLQENSVGVSAQVREECGSVSLGVRVDSRWVSALVQEREGWRQGPGVGGQCGVSGRHFICGNRECQGRFRCWREDTMSVSLCGGILVPQVFQECGVPPKAMTRARRAPAPVEEVGRFWTAGAEEERPTTAAGMLPRMVSWGQATCRCQAGEWACAAAPPPLSARPGVGAPREVGPGPGLLGRAAPDGVWGPPYGHGHRTGGSTLLDRNWAGPVRPGQMGKVVGGRGPNPGTGLIGRAG